MTLDELLVKEEGLRLKPYPDTEGKLTIGVGRNLEDVGLSREEAMFLFRNDRDRAIAAVKDRLPWSESHDPVRRMVLQAMAFQMGINGLARFKKMLSAMERRDYGIAANEMLNSKWAEQTPARAKRMAELMRFGQM